MVKPPPIDTDNDRSLESGCDEEEFFGGLPEWRLPEEKWRELISIVAKAGGSPAKLRKLRGSLESWIGFIRHEWPALADSSRRRDRELIAEWGHIAATARALSLALEEQKRSSGLFGKQSVLAEFSEFSGKKRDAFLSQLEILAEFSSRLSNQKLRSSSRSDRHVFWQQLIWFWESTLDLEVTSSESSPLLKFIRTCSEAVALDRECDVLRPSDLDPENIRSFVRKWLAERSRPGQGGRNS